MNARTNTDAESRRGERPFVHDGRTDLAPKPYNPLAPLALVAFCYRCVMLKIPRGAYEVCPNCGEVSNRGYD